MQVSRGDQMSQPGKTKKMEFIANLATTVAAVLVSVVLVKVYLLPASLAAKGSVSPAPAIAAGASLKGSVSGVDWSRNGRTLVLALSTRCHFCTESAPFFRRIVEEKSRGIKVVAVLPESVAEAEQYLSRESVHVDQVAQLALTSVGIRGTPMMLLVNSSGIVTDVWVGKLDPSAQELVLSALRETAPPNPPTVESRIKGGG